jgi:hypothetical protein
MWRGVSLESTQDVVSFSYTYSTVHLQGFDAQRGLSVRHQSTSHLHLPTYPPRYRTVPYRTVP